LIDVNPVLAGRCLHEGRAKVGRETRQAAIDALLSTIVQPEIALRVRIAAGEVLGFLGDPRIPDPRDLEAMIHIPAGEFLMGTSPEQVEQLLRKHPNWNAKWFEKERPQRRVYLDEYWIDKYPVTNSQYQQFIADGGYSQKGGWSQDGWRWRQAKNRTAPRYWDDLQFNKPNYPVVGVTFYEAEAYARWAGKRLPTGAQWEKAARGMDGRIYPWGDAFDPNRCNCSEGEFPMSTTSVGIYPLGVSPSGVWDMAGNVWEWCADWYADDYYQKSPARNPRGPNSGKYRLLRGGSWGHFVPNGLRVASRDRYIPEFRLIYIGCRCASPRVPLFGS